MRNNTNITKAILETTDPGEEIAGRHRGDDVTKTENVQHPTLNVQRPMQTEANGAAHREEIARHGAPESNEDKIEIAGQGNTAGVMTDRFRRQNRRQILRCGSFPNRLHLKVSPRKSRPTPWPIRFFRWPACFCKSPSVTTST